MSEYLVQRQSLENIADEIRVLSGTTEPLGLTEMATNVNEANDEIADQTDLIAQVVSALQGKSVPGSGEDVTVETETYTDLLTDLEAAVDALPDAGGGGGSGRGSCEVTFTNTNIRSVTFTVHAPDHAGTADQYSPLYSETITVNAESTVTRTYKQGDFLCFDGIIPFPNNGGKVSNNVVVLPLMSNDEIEVG